MRHSPRLCCDACHHDRASGRSRPGWGCVTPGWLASLLLCLLPIASGALCTRTVRLWVLHCRSPPRGFVARVDLSSSANAWHLGRLSRTGERLRGACWVLACRAWATRGRWGELRLGRGPQMRQYLPTLVARRHSLPSIVCSRGESSSRGSLLRALPFSSTNYVGDRSLANQFDSPLRPCHSCFITRTL